MRTWTRRLALAQSALAFAFASGFGSSAASYPLDGLRGGPTCMGWTILRGLLVSGSFESSGLRFHFEKAIDPRSGRFAVRYAGGTAAPGGGEGFDGAIYWSQDGSGTWHGLTSPHERALAISRAWLARRGWCAAGSAGAHAVSLGTRTQGAEQFEAVRVVPRNGLPIEIWIDARAQLIDRTILQLAENREIDHFSDWRTAGSAAFPFLERVEDPEDQETTVWSTRRIVQSAALASSSFAAPAQPRDVTMLHGVDITSVPYRIEAQKPIVDVWLNGKGPFPFVLDSGGHLILTPQTAQTLGLEGVGAANSTGQGTAIQKTSFARVATIRVGDALVRDQIAAIIPYSFARLERGTLAPKAGWLGLQFFERFQLTMNPATHRLTLRPLSLPRIPPRGVRVPLLFEEDAPLVACRIAGHAGTCMVDTGNAGPTIVEGHWLEREGMSDRLHHGLDEDGDRIGRATIAFASLTLPRELADFSPPAVRGSESTQAVAAILSQDVFDRYVTTFDYRDGWMSLTALGIPPAPYNRSGLGLRKRDDGTFLVTFVFAGSPAAVAGFRTGDRILRANGIAAAQLSGAQMFALNHEALGTVVHYEIVRDGAELRLDVRLRDLI